MREIYANVGARRWGTRIHIRGVRDCQRQALDATSNGGGTAAPLQCHYT